MFNFIKNCQTVSKVIVPLFIPISNVRIPAAHIPVFSILADMPWMMTHGIITLHIPNSQWYWTLFMCLPARLWWSVCLLVFYPCFNRVIKFWVFIIHFRYSLSFIWTVYFIECYGLNYVSLSHMHSYVEVLTHSILESEHIWKRKFKEVTKAKWSHMGLMQPGIFTERRRDTKETSMQGKGLWKHSKKTASHLKTQEKPALDGSWLSSCPGPVVFCYSSSSKLRQRAKFFDLVQSVSFSFRDCAFPVISRP